MTRRDRDNVPRWLNQLVVLVTAVLATVVVPAGASMVRATGSDYGTIPTTESAPTTEPSPTTSEPTTSEPTASTEPPATTGPVPTSEPAPATSEPAPSSSVAVAPPPVPTRGPTITDPPTPPTVSPSLPNTGGNGATMSIIALGLLAAGTALVAVGRRRPA